MTGSENTAIGENALQGNSAGSFATGLGFGTDAGSNFSNATAIGAFARVAENNALVLGGITGTNGCGASYGNPCASVSVGIGTTAPKATLDVEAPTGSPTVNFGSASNPASFTVNGTTTVGSLTVTGTCTGCGGSGSGGGTVSNVGTGLGLTGGPITGSGTLSINTAVVPQLAGGNSFSGAQSVNGAVNVTGNTTVTGNIAASAVEG